MDGPGARPANSMTLRPVRGGGPIGEDDAMVMFFSFRVSALEWDRMLKRGRYRFEVVACRFSASIL